MKNTKELCYIASERRLPIKGTSEYIYSTVCRRRQWLWSDDLKQYMPYKQKLVKRIVDPYSNIPYVPPKTDIRLNLYYNLITLNTDLTQQANLNLDLTTLFKYTPKEEHTLGDVYQLWIRNVHSSLYQTLKAITENPKSVLSKSLLDGLNQWGYDLWLDRKSEKWLFKINTHVFGIE